MIRHDHDAVCQTLAFCGFGSLPHARLLRVRSISPKWIERLLPHIAFGRARTSHAVQLLVTSPGLRRLGAADDELAVLGREFAHGMTSVPSRQRLGDVGTNEPRPGWWTDRDHEAGVLLYGDSPQAVTELARQVSQGITVCGAIDLRLPRAGREHFGFLDGIRPVYDANNPLPTGERFLGHPDGTGNNRNVGILGQHGSFVVLREFHQDVRAFWRYWMAAAGEVPERAIFLAAKAVGRWPNGMPLEPDQLTEPPFVAEKLPLTSFGNDQHGRGCPYGSHVRRANPRDTLLASPDLSRRVTRLHTIARRGRIFGPPAPHDWYPQPLRSHLPHADRDQAEGTRGLMFVGLCTDIRRQFEFIMQNWVFAPKFADLYSEVDPILGRADGPRTFTIPTETFAYHLDQVGGWVHPRGGGYYLLPARPALERLSDAAASTTSSEHGKPAAHDRIIEEVAPG